MSLAHRMRVWSPGLFAQARGALAHRKCGHRTEEGSPGRPAAQPPALSRRRIAIHRRNRAAAARSGENRFSAAALNAPCQPPLVESACLHEQIKPMSSSGPRSRRRRFLTAWDTDKFVAEDARQACFKTTRPWHRENRVGPMTMDYRQFLSRRTSIKAAGDQEYTLGEEGRFRLKGRCRRCWGGLIGKGGAEHVPTAIRCCVCGFLLEGKDAREEHQRMSEQNSSNTFQMAFGFPSKYHDDARFVSKIFPHIDRQPAEEFHERTSAEAEKGTREGWLTRREFPGGSAGFLFLQARALMSGVERLPRELSVAHFLGLRHTR